MYSFCKLKVVGNNSFNGNTLRGGKKTQGLLSVSGIGEERGRREGGQWWPKAGALRRRPSRRKGLFLG